ncbi:hypothetical protein Pint_26927 [Pistacia integerrima]|uniref:Uncharacterized protein n=1 Tax=Pistacia integerrima TaxID=434235 RepID=A0ACC0YRF4_9ROSI|nr:hypothetical protein Pint_26927 [Pistacia integerrima]
MNSRKYLIFWEIGFSNQAQDLWRSQRKAAQVLMNHQKFHKFLVKTTLEKEEKGLIPILENVAKEAKAADSQDLFQRFAFDATCMLLQAMIQGACPLNSRKIHSQKPRKMLRNLFLTGMLYLYQKEWKLQR